MKILSFGSLNIDYTYLLDHIVAPGETLSSKKLDVHCGGKGLNQSIALKKAGAEVWHAGKIGKDGSMLRECLEEAGVNTSLIETDAVTSSGHAIIQVEENSAQNSIVICAGTNGLIDKEYIEKVVANFSAGDYAVFQNEITNIDYAMKCCKEKGLHVVFNPSPMTETLAASDIYQYVDDLFINETEGNQITGETDPAKICRILQNRCPHCRVILTLGSDGSVITIGDQLFPQNAYKCNAIDTTAAGDTFLGFFVALTASGKDPLQALDLASKASSLAVRKNGAAESIPTLKEVLEFEF